MAPKHTLGKIKDVAVDTLRNPRGAAGKAVEQAKETATLAGQVAAGAVGVVTARVSGRRTAVAASPGSAKTQGDPMAAPAAKPTTAQAAQRAVRPDPGAPDRLTEAPAPPHVEAEVTPAYVAKVVAKKSPAKKPAARKATPAKKSAPGAKLPPRKATEAPETQPTPPLATESVDVLNA